MFQLDSHYLIIILNLVRARPDSPSPSQRKRLPTSHACDPSSTSGRKDAQCQISGPVRSQIQCLPSQGCSRSRRDIGLLLLYRQLTLSTALREAACEAATRTSSCVNLPVQTTYWRVSMLRTLFMYLVKQSS